MAGPVTSYPLFCKNPVSGGFSCTSVWLLLFLFKHCECCGSVDRLSTPALADWPAGGLRLGGVRLLEEKVGGELGGGGDRKQAMHRESPKLKKVQVQLCLVYFIYFLL